MNALMESPYRAARRGLPPHTPVTVLQIGEQQSCLIFGTGDAPQEVMVLTIGSVKTASLFKRSPPSPAELEHAIMVVEDELTRARHLTDPDNRLVSSDANLRQLALLTGHSGPDEQQPDITLNVEAVEHTFERWMGLVHGRPAARTGLPSDKHFAATLLILRELMHHLQFGSILIRR